MALYYHIASRGLRSLSLLAIALLVTLPAWAQNGVKMEEKVPYLGKPNNIKLSNGTVELILTTDYGPRIMRYAFVGSGDGDNIFATIPPDKPNLKTEWGDWYIYGGHRLWIAPEVIPTSYEPDNEPIQSKIEGGVIKLIQPIEKHTQIQKEMWITLDPQGSHVTVVHKMTNKGAFPVELSCWALTAMNKGGKAILPQEPYQSHDEEVQPVRTLTLWGYSDLTDPRWKIGKQFITLRQDPTAASSQKVGVLNKQGWSAYSLNGMLFLKRFPYEKGKRYPDLGVNNEAYTDGTFLELETLGPLEVVGASQTLTYTEHWWLYKKVDISNTEASMAAALQPILTETGKK